MNTDPGQHTAYTAPPHQVVTYTNDGERFAKDPTIVAFAKLPAWVKITPTRDPHRRNVGAELMADGPTVKKKKTLHAGLIPTGLQNWFVTDIPDVYQGRTCKNTALFNFSTDARRLTVFFFTGLEKYSIAERVKFAVQVIPRLQVPFSVSHLAPPAPPPVPLSIYALQPMPAPRPEPTQPDHPAA